MVAAPTANGINGVNGDTIKEVQKEEDNLWGSILDSASKGKRAVPNKRVVVLGEQRTGKSTLLSHLSFPPSSSQPNGANLVDPGPSKGFGINGVEPGKAAPLDLGLSYGYVDVGDEGEEDTLALLSFYSLPSPNPPYTSLLPLALPPTSVSLLDSLILIVLDWERPWSFIDTFRRWMVAVEVVLSRIQGWEQDEGRERLERTWRAYSEPGTTAVGTGMIAGEMEDALPLPKGTLSNNLGVDIVVVCTKADQIDVLEKEKDFKEEQFDYIQQALRTVCLTYGAGLFFTSHSRPDSFSRLRSYILHRLFASHSSHHATPSSLSTGANGAGPAVNGLPVPQTVTATAATASRTFPFTHKADVVNRDQVVVPSGWDSWGKIKVIKEGFDADALGKGWERDLEAERRKVKGEKDDDWDGETKASRMYEEVVPDLEAEDQPRQFGSRSATSVKDEQDFLKDYYETLQKDREKDPRAAFQQRGGAAANRTPNQEQEPRMASVVGPMASTTSLNLTSVERALDRDVEDVGARVARMVRKDGNSSIAPSRNLSSTLSSSSYNAPPPLSATTSRPSLSSSSLLSPTTPNGQGPQTEVIANFFQDLLKRKLPEQGAGRGISGLSSSLSAGMERGGSPQTNGRGPSSRSPPPPPNNSAA
ncbi:dynein light intermediate chain [Atractiella rhizophila]|nr:dynein light intermediate chain [Atractiella rhizophila]